MKPPGFSDHGAAPLVAVKHVLKRNRRRGVQLVSKAVADAGDRPHVLTEEAVTP